MNVFHIHCNSMHVQFVNRIQSIQHVTEKQQELCFDIIIPNRLPVSLGAHVSQICTVLPY